MLIAVAEAARYVVDFAGKVAHFKSRSSATLFIDASQSGSALPIFQEACHGPDQVAGRPVSVGQFPASFSSSFLPLGGHPNPAIEGHFKTGHR